MKTMAMLYALIVTTNVLIFPYLLANIPDDNFEQALIDLGYDRCIR